MQFDLLSRAKYANLPLPGLRPWRFRIDLGSGSPIAVESLRLRYFALMASIERRKEGKDAAAAAEAVRLRRLREDAKRPMSVNLAEGIALSHQLMRFTGVARPN